MFQSADHLSIALEYAQRGWHVFPCHFISNGSCSCGNQQCKRAGKHPMTSDGFKSATNNLDAIREWWMRFPGANVGVRTGPESGVWVLDLDGPEGIGAWQQILAIHGPEFVTVSASTGGGGRHLYFRYPEDLEIGNRTRIEGRQIDVRGNGGYVIAPPSNHRSGTPYSWLTPPGSAELVLAPDWVIEFVTNKKAPRAGAPSADGTAESQPTGELDLRSDPGVGEGQRHDRAVRLIGSHLGRGEDPVDVVYLALQWARRCNPPHEDEDIVRIVKDLHFKDQAKLNEPIAQVERPWPVLSEDAYYGLAGEIVKAIEPSTEADPVAILIQILTFFGNAAGRNSFFRVEATKHHPNLFAVLVGETSIARKGTSEQQAKAFFETVDPDWALKRHVSGLSSGEGIIWAVRDPIEKRSPIKEGRVTIGHQSEIVDHGVSDKRLFVSEGEFASVLKITRREGNTLSPIIRLAWDGGILQQVIKNAPGRATGAHVSIVGHITKDELLASIQTVDSFNGFANRFLWLCVRRSKLLPDGGAPIDRTPYLESLRTALAKAKEPGEMLRSPDAVEFWKEVYTDLSNGKKGLLGAVTARSAAQVLRLSVIFALLDQSKIIHPVHIRAALAIWRYAESSALYVFGDSTGNQLADQFFAILQEGPATKTELHARTHRHYSSEEVNSALSVLLRQKRVRREIIKTGGRSAEKWHAL